MSNKNSNNPENPLDSPPGPNWDSDQNQDKADWCPVCRGKNFLRQELPLGHPNFGKLVPCDCERHRQQQARQNQSQLQGWLQLAAFENFKLCQFNRAAYRAAFDFARTPHGWLTLCGPYGNGKSHLLAAVVNFCNCHGVWAVYYTLPDLLDLLRDSYADHDYSPQFRHLVTVPVLAIDELDKVNRTAWSREKLYQLADARYRRSNELGTLWALNGDPKSALLGGDDPHLGYLYSRMCDERSTIIHLDGPDVRPHAASLWASFSEPDGDSDPDADDDSDSGPDPDVEPMPEAA